MSQDDNCKSTYTGMTNRYSPISVKTRRASDVYHRHKVNWSGFEDGVLNDMKVNEKKTTKHTLRKGLRFSNRVRSA
jgi:hypothetical protein